MIEQIKKKFEKKVSEPWPFRIQKFITISEIPSTLDLSVKFFSSQIANQYQKVEQPNREPHGIEQTTDQKQAEKTYLKSFRSGLNVAQCFQLEADSTEPLFWFDVSIYNKEKISSLFI